MQKKKIEIIYADDDIFVINKPSGLSVTKNRTGLAQLTDILTEQLGSKIAGQLRLVHRLDKDTSGVMILARNKETQSMFSSYFEKGLIEKTYLTLVTGIVPALQGTISTPIARNPKNPALMCVAVKKGKKAITEWKLLADFGIIALLAVNPLTGRTHQIRIHLPNVGLAFLIDPLYGNSRPFFLSDFKSDYRLGKGKTEKPLIDRLTLHAYQIESPIPEQAYPDCFIARLDKKFAATIKMLTKYNPKGLDAFLDPDDFSKIINARKLD